jgi:dipeptidyl aminopeptidase/acylaminoacyl peptidase
MLALQPSTPFSTVISVAPVTDWLLYDSIYTERYMLTPALNQYGYNESSLFWRAGSLNTNYVLIHGSSDDNVHYQNSVLLVNISNQYQNKFIYVHMVDLIYFVCMFLLYLNCLFDFIYFLLDECIN